MSGLSACVGQRCPHIKNAYMSAGPYGQCFITLSMQTLEVIFISLSISIVLGLCSCLRSWLHVECAKNIFFVQIVSTPIPFRLGSNTHFTCPFWWQNILVYVTLNIAEILVYVSGPRCWTRCYFYVCLDFNQIVDRRTNSFKWFHLAVWLS